MSQTFARFADPPALASAIRALRDRGLERIDAVTPFASEEVERALGPRPSRIPWLAGAAAAAGVVIAFEIIDWTNARDYALDVGGRPLHSVFADVPIMFETSILAAGLCAFFAFFVASRLPRLHHPWFEVNLDAFWLVVDARDVGPEVDALLREHGALETREVSS
ncbi:MAG TPA: DUF3341 domain-containing protein [Polyangiaceae bacterium]|jgi:hypothetical protein|nr:DUF3341 domain-containing protein [Polyangiaceae bacterium]